MSKMLNKYRYYIDTNDENVLNFRNCLLEKVYNEELSLNELNDFYKIDKEFINSFDSDLIKRVYNNYVNNLGNEYYKFKKKEQKLIKRITKENVKNSAFKLKKLRNNISEDYYNFMYIEGNKYDYTKEDIYVMRKLVNKYLAPLYNKIIINKKYDFNINDYNEIINYIVNNEVNNKNVNLIISKSNGVKYYPNSKEYDLKIFFKNDEKTLFNIAHEYGHIYQLENNHELVDYIYMNYDISEIFSSYNEYLCLNILDNKILNLIHLKRVLKIIISSIIGDEFNEYFYSENNNVEFIENKWIEINKKYDFKGKAWFDNIKRIAYPSKTIDYAVAYIATLYKFNDYSIKQYKGMRDNFRDYDFKMFVKNNDLGNPFIEQTYIEIKERIEKYLYENSNLFN